MRELLLRRGTYAGWVRVCAATCCHMLFASCFRAMQDARSDLEEAMEVAAHVTGVAQVTGKLGPTQMMLCKPDLSDKHMRWFLIDADACTIEWAKKVCHSHECQGRRAPRLRT